MGVIPKDLDMFEQYWIDQFSNLLNVVGNETSKQDSAVARQVKAALQAQIDSTRNRKI